MARTISMNLVELMVMKDDISSVIEFLGKKGNFQFQSHKSSEKDAKLENSERDLFLKLQDARSFLNIEDIDSSFVASSTCADDEDRKTAEKFIAALYRQQAS